MTYRNCSHQFVIFPGKIKKLSNFFFFHIENLFYVVVHAISVPSTSNFCDTYIFSLTSRKIICRFKKCKIMPFKAYMKCTSVKKNMTFMILNVNIKKKKCFTFLQTLGHVSNSKFLI